MPSPSYTQDLIEKLRALHDDELAEVVDLVERLRERHARTEGTPEERLRSAIDTGLITPPEPGRQRSSVTDTPPVSVPGRPLSEIVLEDRR